MPEIDIVAFIVEFISAAGPVVMLPVVITGLSLAFGVKWDTALKAGLTTGIAFVGLFAVLDIMIATLDSLISGILATIGYKMTVIDLGWLYPVSATIAWWGMPISVLSIIGVNVLLLLLGSGRGGTDSISIYDMTMQVDYTGLTYFTYLGTGSYLIGLAVGIIAFYATMRLGDWWAPLTQDPEVYNQVGLSWSHPCIGMAAPAVWFDKYVLSKIPSVARSRLDPEGLRERFGMFGDPIFITWAMGLIFGGVSYFLGTATLADWAYLSVALAGAVLLFPRMIGILMEGVAPFADGVKTFLDKRMPGRKMWLGLDLAVATGHSTAIAVAVLMIPTTLALAFILPGVGAMPYADLGVMPFAVSYQASAAKGNVVRAYLMSVFTMIFELYFLTFYGPIMTAAAVDAGLPVPTGILASALGWSYYMISPALVIIAVYLFGGAPGAAMLSGERVGIVAVDPNFAFYFSVGFLIVHTVMYWMARDMPLRIANTPLDEYVEKGPRPLEEVKKALPPGELIVPR